MQPISMTYVHGHEFRQGLRLIKGLTGKSIAGISEILPAQAIIQRLTCPDPNAQHHQTRS